MVGRAVTVTVKASPALTQPVAFSTVRVPLYVPVAAPPGTVRTIGVTGRAVNATSTKPANSAAASKSIRYCVGVAVVAV